MIRFFKSSYIIQYSAILLAGVFLWGRSFFDPPPMPEPRGFVPLYQLLYHWLYDFPPAQSVVGFLLVAGSALLINIMFSAHNIVQKNSSLTGFIFLILMSYYPAFHTVHPVNIAVFFLLLVLSRLLSSYNNPEPLSILFSSGFITAFASYFYFPFIFFYGYILTCLIIFRQFKWREWISSSMGLILPFVFLGTYYFWIDSLPGKMKEYGAMFNFSLDFSSFREPVFIFLTSIIFFSSLFAMYFGFRHRFDKTIERTRKNLLIIWMIFFAAGTVLFDGGLISYHFELMFIPFSAAVSYYLMYIKKTFLPEKILLLFILIIAVNNIFFRWP